ncbi:P-loop NTPase fold protein [Candidatus Tisiphia endosymbiont of Metellina segmentata]|uniref:P-loop NTPase fold protein n=1 Tax=Candidatus Tisiphia endosymbiont of Metellina segmentata TaxID=3066274 RepID=UPI00313C8E78
MTSSDSQSCISKPNEHIEKYLDDYCNNMSKKKSNYAVLIAGDWGIGKTQFINKYIDSLHNIAYISLNGISKTSDLSKC